jgi:hypothetical protein
VAGANDSSSRDEPCLDVSLPFLPSPASPSWSQDQVLVLAPSSTVSASTSASAAGGAGAGAAAGPGVGAEPGAGAGAGVAAGAGAGIVPVAGANDSSSRDEPCLDVSLPFLPSPASPPWSQDQEVVLSGLTTQALYRMAGVTCLRRCGCPLSPVPCECFGYWASAHLVVLCAM